LKASLQTAIRLYRSKRYAAALKELHALDDDPGDVAELAYYLGLCYTQLRNYEEALIYLEQVVTSDADLVHVYQSRMILSYIYTITGRHRLAVFELESLLESGYESAQVYAAFGFVSYETGKIAEAIDYLEKALGIDPDNANALNSLGYILAETGTDLPRALDCCKKAVRKNDRNPAYLDSLGWVHHKLGNRNEAIYHLRKALAVSNADREVADHLRKAMEGSRASGKTSGRSRP
jgi:tetratricopeptide (TPR) repeat protein